MTPNADTVRIVREPATTEPEVRIVQPSNPDKILEISTDIPGIQLGTIILQILARAGMVPKRLTIAGLRGNMTTVKGPRDIIDVIRTGLILLNQNE